jgi:hypothetical protein
MSVYHYIIDTLVYIYFIQIIFFFVKLIQPLDLILYHLCFLLYFEDIIQFIIELILMKLHSKL